MSRSGVRVPSSAFSPSLIIPATAANSLTASLCLPLYCSCRLCVLCVLEGYYYQCVRRAEKVKLAKRTVEALKPDSERQLLFYDDGLPGFGVGVSLGGPKSYFVQYCSRHLRSRRYTLGRHGVLRAEHARRPLLARRRPGCGGSCIRPLSHHPAGPRLPDRARVMVDVARRPHILDTPRSRDPVSYTHLRAHETDS